MYLLVYPALLLSLYLQTRSLDLQIRNKNTDEVPGSSEHLAASTLLRMLELLGGRGLWAAQGASSIRLPSSTGGSF